MAVAKVTVNNVVKVDLTSDTVAADKLVSDYTAHGADGEAITGTYADSGGAVESDVNFYDYDGTLVKSYTAADFASLTAFPANPSHTGLTAQGWNWPLATAKDYVATYGRLDIGQMYITDDGKTRFYITIDEPSLLSIGMYIVINGSGYIDWGDESNLQSVSGRSLTAIQPYNHNYATVGDYVISIWANSGSQIGLMNGSSNPLFYYGNNTVSGTTMDSYRGSLSILKKVECGNIVKLGQYAFHTCYNLTTISMSNVVAEVGIYAFANTGLKYVVVPSSLSLTSSKSAYLFYYDRNLKGICLPHAGGSSVSAFGSDCFYHCASLRHIMIPSNCNQIGQNCFLENYALEFAVIPDSVSTISSYAFSDCQALTYVITHTPIFTQLPQSMFAGCNTLRSFTIPSSITSIESGAFTTTNFTHIDIPEGVTTIKSSAFAYIYAIVYLSISTTVTSIAASAFYNMYSAQEIHFKGTTPPTISNSNAFTNLNTKCKIYVPTGYRSAYTGATNYPSSSTYTYIEE